MRTTIPIATIGVCQVFGVRCADLHLVQPPNGKTLERNHPAAYLLYFGGNPHARLPPEGLKGGGPVPIGLLLVLYSLT